MRPRSPQMRPDRSRRPSAPAPDPTPPRAPRTGEAAMDGSGRGAGEQVGMGGNEKELVSCGRSFAMQGGGVSRRER